MLRSRVLAVTVVATILASALAAPTLAQDEERPLGPPEATPNPVALETPSGDGTGVRLATDLGDVVIGVFTESAPVAAENFLNLVRSGFYDGVGFHRVAPGFVIQGGDPDGTGGGGPGYTITDEEVVGEYGRGIVAMARTPAPDSQGSQFFVVLDDAARGSLDAARTYVIFGRVIEGMDVVDAIAERGPASNQIEDPVRIRSATVEQVELPPEPTPAPPTAAEMAAEALAAKVPAEIAGVALSELGTFTSDQIISQAPPEVLARLEEALEASGRDLERLSIVQAGVPEGEAPLAILATSIEGVPAVDVLAPLASLVMGVAIDAPFTVESIAGREVRRYEQAPGQAAYVLASDDVAWFFIADEASLEDVVNSLP